MCYYKAEERKAKRANFPRWLEADQPEQVELHQICGHRYRPEQQFEPEVHLIVER